jgi:hypothetical protein
MTIKDKVCWIILERIQGKYCQAVDTSKSFDHLLIYKSEKEALRKAKSMNDLQIALLGDIDPKLIVNPPYVVTQVKLTYGLPSTSKRKKGQAND